MVDPPRSSADGSGGSGGSGGGKHPSSSSPPLPPSPPAKRPKAGVMAKGDEETGKPEEEAPAAAAAEEVAATSSRSPVATAAQEEAGTSSRSPGSQAVEPVPWATLTSHEQEIPHAHLIFETEFSVGRNDGCDIRFTDTSRVLCKLRRLEQPGRCLLQVKGKTGLVELNGSKIGKGENLDLLQGDKVSFCKLAYIFQPNNTIPISASAILCCQNSKDGLKKGILDPDALQVTLANFKYYLSENTKKVLLSTARVLMKKKFRHMNKEPIEILSRISPLNPRILLSGPSGSEIYQEALVKALAKDFGARLLIVDSLLLPDSSGDQEAETLGIDELMEVISEESINSNLIVLVKDVAKTLTGRTGLHASLGNKLPLGVLIIGSHTEKDSLTDKGSSGSTLQERNKDSTNSMEHLENLFPTKISIELPKDEEQLSELMKQLRLDAENIGVKANSPDTRKEHAGSEQPKETPKDEDRSSSDDSGRYMPKIPVGACIARIGIAGERMQAFCESLAGYHGSMIRMSEFLRQVAAYAPTGSLVGETRPALGRIMKACGEVGAFLGHAATTVQGVTAMGQMLGSSFRSLARVYGPEVVPEPEPEPEPESKPDATSEPTRILISTVEQVREVVEWVLGRSAAAVEVDVGLEVTPFFEGNRVLY